MEVKLPPQLGAAIDAEIAASSKTWRTRREYILDAVSDKLAHDRGSFVRMRFAARSSSFIP